MLCARFRNRETRSGKSISKSATSSPAVVAKVAVTVAPVESTRARERVVNCELHSQTNTHTHTQRRDMHSFTQQVMSSLTQIYTNKLCLRYTTMKNNFVFLKFFVLLFFSFIFIWLICCSHTRKTHASGCTHMHMYAAITRVDGRSNSSSSDVGSVSSARPSTNAPHTLSHSIWG